MLTNFLLVVCFLVVAFAQGRELSGKGGVKICPSEVLHQLADAATLKAAEKTVAATSNNVSINSYLAAANI